MIPVSQGELEALLGVFRALTKKDSEAAALSAVLPQETLYTTWGAHGGVVGPWESEQEPKLRYCTIKALVSPLPEVGRLHS